MSDQIKDFENKIRKYHSLPEAIVIDSNRIGYPFYILSLDVTYLAQRDLELLEEFIMKCIDYGVNYLEEIAIFLGMNNHLIEKALSELISKDLIKKEDILELTEKGLDALKQQTVLALVSNTKTFYLDALSGKLMDYFSFSQFDPKQNQNSRLISKIIKKPRKDHVEDIVSYYEYIEKSLRNPNNPNIELIQVNRIENIYLEWHEIFLVLYRRNPTDTEIEYEIFSRDSIQKDYRETIEKLYAEGKKILDPIFQDMRQDDSTDESFSQMVHSINDEDVRKIEQISIEISSLSDSDSLIDAQEELVKTKKSKLNKQLKEIKNKTRISEVIHTYEIREYLLKALRESKTRVMIISPWIKGNVVNKEFISTLEDTLKRKVQVYIIYGIKGSSFQNDIWSIKQLETISGNYHDLKFEKTNNSHRKQIVCDNKFAIVTSFNFLSFRADPSLTYRDELGVVLRDQETIEDLFNSGLDLIN